MHLKRFSCVRLQTLRRTPPAFRSILTPDFTQRGASPLTALGAQDEVEIANRTTDCYTLARRLATNYHLSVIETLKNLKKLYPEGQVPYEHFDSLCKQVEDQQQNYEVIEERITEYLALIRIHDDDGNLLFEKDDTDGCYIHRVRLRKSKADLLLSEEGLDDNHDVSFHYTPYDFDSGPEQNFFKTILLTLNQSVANVKVFLFTGSLTNTKKNRFPFLNTKALITIITAIFPILLSSRTQGNSTSLRLSLKANAATQP